LPAASFMNEEMPVPLVDENDGAQWLGPRIAAHPRYAYGVMRPMFVGLTGAELVDAPQDVTDPAYDAELLAFRVQNRALTNLSTRFRDEMQLRIKPLVKAIVRDPVFRARATRDASVDAVRAAALVRAGYGRGALITPEQMARKLEDATGVVYDDGVAFGGRDLFTSLGDYRLLWGGVDFRDIVARFRSTSPLHGAIAARTGNEVACQAVVEDFRRAAAERVMLGGVEVTTTDDATVRATIRRLHLAITGEYLAADDPELDETLALWRDARALGLELIGSGDSTTTQRSCAGNIADPEYTVRAWIAVVSYLISDARSLFD